MKAFTDISQSKKLAEILPLESADMHLTNSSINGEMYVDEFNPVLVPYLRAKDSLDAYSKIVNNMIAWEVIPCWSLVALFNVLPEIQGSKPVIALYDNYITYPHMSGLHTIADNLVDACVAMIEKIHVLNLL